MAHILNLEYASTGQEERKVSKVTEDLTWNLREYRDVTWTKSSFTSYIWIMSITDESR